jgi:hypothetical protein
MIQADRVHSTPPTNTSVETSRRGFFGVIAAFTAAPAIALPAPVDAANVLWAERQRHVDRLQLLSHDYDAAHAKLPAWAISGPERLDANGNFCGDHVAWPLIEDLTPPSIGERIVRPSIYQAKEHFDFAVSVFASSPKTRENCRATMRRNIKAIVARLRARKRLYAELGLDRIDREMSEACIAMCQAEDAIRDLPAAPNVVAASLLAGLTNDCNRSDFAEGNGYCGTMAMALVALRGLLSDLSGAIRDDAVCFVSNPTLPLGAMPFAPL